ncbi:hypothetical protein FACUT_10699 [Fusarium acutatum]|uniref:Uncharacterized protein n=1 Tax=Fusarium acutatum TaxID=78861 RepID=A0A8H4NDP7_9HYPO|nr:hypothetical protein FACUT_10699 [Fusarium acutatum]
MVRNHPQDPFQRRNLVERISSSYLIRSELIGAIHGYVGETKKPATLLVLSFLFDNLKQSVRIRSANITVEFYGDDSFPTVAAMAPYGEVKAFENTFEETIERGIAIELSSGSGNGLGASRGSTVVKERKSSVVLTGYKSRKGNAIDLRNLPKVAKLTSVANWTIVEDPHMKEGVPPYLQTAILLERTTDEIFKADININADVSGFSFRNLKDGLLESEDDPVIFDPGASPLIPNYLAGQNLDDLGSIDLSQLYVLESFRFDPDTRERITIGQTIKDLFSEERPAVVKSVKYEVEASFIDLWDDKFSAVDRHKLDTPLGHEDLKKYFSWISETANVGEPTSNSHGSPEAQQVQQASHNTHICNLIVTQSSVSKLTTFNKLEGLLNQPPFELLSDFFDLPPDFLVTRQHDRGGCEVFKDDEKASKLYIIQTPFYSTGFWSLLLHTMVDTNASGAFIKISGVIQVDADFRLTDIFSGVRKLVGRLDHHQTLLPLQLFVSHYGATKDGIDLIQKDIGDVDDRLLNHLKEQGKLDDASKLYRELSMTLHKCSMDLAELGRRRKFEEELGKFLLEDLKNDSKLKVLAEIYLRMSRSRESDVESLPGKIESQRNVHDSYLQARLARESLRDSKAMKTLSILTILFLPGAFIATIFSTNMFGFESKNQQVRIYFAIVIPLTAVLMICWVLWLKNTPERADEESARQSQPGVDLNWLKGSKAD